MEELDCASLPLGVDSQVHVPVVGGVVVTDAETIHSWKEVGEIRRVGRSEVVVDWFAVLWDFIFRVVRIWFFAELLQGFDC